MDTRLRARRAPFGFPAEGTLKSRSKKSHDKIGVGVVIKLNAVIVQSDKTSWLGAWIIRPVEMLDLHLAGIGREIGSEPLAIHAGLDVELEDGRRFVVEQLFGTSRENFVSRLNWTPLETFRRGTTQAGMLRFRPAFFGRKKGSGSCYLIRKDNCADRAA